MNCLHINIVSHIIYTRVSKQMNCPHINIVSHIIYTRVTKYHNVAVQCVSRSLHHTMYQVERKITNMPDSVPKYTNELPRIVTLYNIILTRCTAYYDSSFHLIHNMVQ